MNYTSITGAAIVETDCMEPELAQYYMKAGCTRVFQDAYCEDAGLVELKC